MVGKSFLKRNHLLFMQPLQLKKPNGWLTSINASQIFFQKVSKIKSISAPFEWHKMRFLSKFFPAGKQPSTEHAAVWIPDNEASLCMLCRKTKFTTLNRRVRCYVDKFAKCDEFLLYLFYIISWNVKKMYFINSIIVGNVVVLFVVIVPQRDSCYLNSHQNLCECVTNVIVN